jgi:hypothetical protein
MWAQGGVAAGHGDGKPAVMHASDAAGEKRQRSMKLAYKTQAGLLWQRTAVAYKQVPSCSAWVLWVCCEHQGQVVKSRPAKGVPAKGISLHCGEHHRYMRSHRCDGPAALVTLLQAHGLHRFRRLAAP